MLAPPPSHSSSFDFALRPVLLRLLAMPGAAHACIADPDTGELMAEEGEPVGGAAAAAAVLSWGRHATAMFAAAPGDELDDFMISSARGYHVVRRVAAGGSTFLVYLALDRSRSNLAVARRELAAKELRTQLAEAICPPVVSSVLPRRVPAAPPAPLPVLPAPRPTPGHSSTPGHPSTPSVLTRTWADDLDTMRRLVTGLRLIA